MCLISLIALRKILFYAINENNRAYLSVHSLTKFIKPPALLVRS